MLISQEDQFSYMLNGDPIYRDIIPDYLDLKYDFLLKTLKKGALSLELKCLLLVLVLYLPGLLITMATNTWEAYFFGDWRRLVVDIFIALFLWLMVRFLSRIKTKMQRVSRIIAPPHVLQKGRDGREEWSDWQERIKKFKREMNESPHLWNLLALILGLIGGVLVNIYFVDATKVSWIQGSRISEIYFRSWYVGVGILVSAAVYGIFSGFYTLRRYCRDVISAKVILPLDPDKTGGLKELGRLSLDLDLMTAIPSITFPLYLLGNPQYTEMVKGSFFWWGISILYAIALILVFFISISPAHDDMAKAKDEYILKIHLEYRDMHEQILRKLEPEKLMDHKDYGRLSGLYELYDRVNSMAVWPLDFQTTIRFVITSILPILSIGISISMPLPMG